MAPEAPSLFPNVQSHMVPLVGDALTIARRKTFWSGQPSVAMSLTRIVVRSPEASGVSFRLWVGTELMMSMSDGYAPIELLSPASFGLTLRKHVDPGVQIRLELVWEPSECVIRMSLAEWRQRKRQHNWGISGGPSYQQDRFRINWGAACKVAATAKDERHLRAGPIFPGQKPIWYASAVAVGSRAE